MRIKFIAMGLLLCTLFGVFGCTASVSECDEVFLDEQINFIGGKSEGLGTTSEVERPETLLNFAATDEGGAPLFQIVYASNASNFVKDECYAFSNTIREITGVTLSVVDSNAKKKNYEILVGDIARAETIDAKDQYRLAENDFVICTVGTRVIQL